MSLAAKKGGGGRKEGRRDGFKTVGKEVIEKEI